MQFSAHQISSALAFCEATRDHRQVPGYKAQFFEEFAVFNSDNGAVLCFKGTNERGEWYENIKQDLVRSPVGPGLVHYGFRKLYIDVRDAVTEALRTPKNLLICGHSLGGALSLLAAKDFEAYVPQVITFGAPRTGNSNFCNSIRFPFCRVENSSDIVTRLPPWFFGYRHAGEVVRLEEPGGHDLATYRRGINNRFSNELNHRAFLLESCAQES